VTARGYTSAIGHRVIVNKFEKGDVKSEEWRVQVLVL
jgi:hypothetical protein